MTPRWFRIPRRAAGHVVVRLTEEHGDPGHPGRFAAARGRPCGRRPRPRVPGCQPGRPRARGGVGPPRRPLGGRGAGHGPVTCRSPARRDAGEAAAPAGDAGDAGDAGIGRWSARKPARGERPPLPRRGHGQSADRVLTVLDHLATARAATFSGIASALGLPNSSAHDLLQTMVRRGYLEYDPQGRTYGLGLRLWQVAQTYAGHRDLVAVARPVMEELVAVTGETVQLARLDGVENVYLAIAESPHPMSCVRGGRPALRARDGAGQGPPRRARAGRGRQRLAAQPLPRFTPYTVTDVDALDGAPGRRSAIAATPPTTRSTSSAAAASPCRSSMRSARWWRPCRYRSRTPRYGPEVAVRAMDALRDGVTRLSTRLGHAPESKGAQG